MAGVTMGTPIGLRLCSTIHNKLWYTVYSDSFLPELHFSANWATVADLLDWTTWTSLHKNCSLGDVLTQSSCLVFQLLVHHFWEEKAYVMKRQDNQCYLVHLSVVIMLCLIGVYATIFGWHLTKINNKNLHKPFLFSPLCSIRILAHQSGLVHPCGSWQTSWPFPTLWYSHRRMPGQPCLMCTNRCLRCGSSHCDQCACCWPFEPAEKGQPRWLISNCNLIASFICKDTIWKVFFWSSKTGNRMML